MRKEMNVDMIRNLNSDQFREFRQSLQDNLNKMSLIDSETGDYDRKAIMKYTWGKLYYERCRHIRGSRYYDPKKSLKKDFSRFLKSAWSMAKSAREGWIAGHIDINDDYQMLDDWAWNGKNGVTEDDAKKALERICDDAGLVLDGRLIDLTTLRRVYGDKPYEGWAYSTKVHATIDDIFSVWKDFKFYRYQGTDSMKVTKIVGIKWVDVPVVEPKKVKPVTTYAQIWDEDTECGYRMYPQTVYVPA